MAGIKLVGGGNPFGLIEGMAGWLAGWGTQKLNSVGEYQLNCRSLPS